MSEAVIDQNEEFDNIIDASYGNQPPPNADTSLGNVVLKEIIIPFGTGLMTEFTEAHQQRVASKIDMITLQSKDPQSGKVYDH